jgi:hypothetical protein
MRRVDLPVLTFRGDAVLLILGLHDVAPEKSGRGAARQYVAISMNAASICSPLRRGRR